MIERLAITAVGIAAAVVLTVGLVAAGFAPRRARRTHRRPSSTRPCWPRPRRAPRPRKTRVRARGRLRQAGPRARDRRRPAPGRRVQGGSLGSRARTLDQSAAVRSARPTTARSARTGGPRGPRGPRGGRRLMAEAIPAGGMPDPRGARRAKRASRGALGRASRARASARTPAEPAAAWLVRRRGPGGCLGHRGGIGRLSERGGRPPSQPDAAGHGRAVAAVAPARQDARRAARPLRPAQAGPEGPSRREGHPGEGARARGSWSAG